MAPAKNIKSAAAREFPTKIDRIVPIEGGMCVKLDFVLLMLSVLCFINPTVDLVDPIPDFIGYLMLYIGMRRLCRDNDSLTEARKRAAVLAGITAALAVIAEMFPDMSGMTMLLISFVAAVAEAIVFIPMITGYLDGMTYLVTRHGSEDNTANPAKLKRYSIIAFLVKDAAMFLPLLPALTDSSYVFADGEAHFSQFTDLYVLFSVAVVWAVSIPWAVKFIKVHRKMSSDKAFTKALSEKYEKEVLAFPKRITAGNMTKMLTVTVIASVFLFGFYTDNVNIFPDFIAAVLFAFCFVLMSGAPKALRISGVLADTVWAVFSFVSMKLQINFAAENYTPEWALHEIGKSAEMYKKIEIFAAVEAVFMALNTVLFLICLFRAVKAHKKEVMNSERVRGTEKYIIPFAVFLSLVTLLNFVIAPMMKYFPEIWMINGALIIALVVSAYRMYRNLSENLYHRMSI